MHAPFALAAAAALVCASSASATAAHADPVGPFLPWGIHMAYGADPQTSLSLMWSTRKATRSTSVRVTSVASGLSTTFVGNASLYSDSNNMQYIHTTALAGLEAGGHYTYSVGDEDGNRSSDSLSFALHPVAGQQWGGGRDYPVVTIYGDMGVAANAHKSLPLLYNDVAQGKMDVILHVGDIAYDLQSNNGGSGDEFVVEIEPLASRIPVHFCPGNHEDYNDFGQYRTRFNQMPGGAAVRKAQSVFHSFNVGLLHIILFSSEAFFTVGEYSLLLLPDMFAFVEADLAAVDRTVTPWIITLAHQPMYCSPNDDNDDCHSLVSLMRDGVLGQFGFEELINRYGVEMHFGAHEHAYERNYPVYQYEWSSNVTGAAAYVDFKRTVQMISGAAGCPENTDPWQANSTANAFSAFRVADYGYGRLHVLNKTHLYWEYQDDGEGAILDSVMLVKNTHGPFFAAAPPQAGAVTREEAFAFAKAAVATQPGGARRMTSETARSLLSPRERARRQLRA